MDEKEFRRTRADMGRILERGKTGNAAGAWAPAARDNHRLDTR
jgi:hypothetical protein